MSAAICGNFTLPPVEERRGGNPFDLVLTIAATLGIVGTLYWFSRKRSRQPLLATFPWYIFYTQALGVLLFIYLGPFRNYIDPRFYPCDVYVSLLFAILPLVMGPAAAKMLSGLFKFKYRRRLATAINADINKRSPYMRSITENIKGREVLSSFRQPAGNDARFVSENRNYRFLASNTFIALFLSIVFILVALALGTFLAVDEFYGSGCFGCDSLPQEILYALIVIGVVLMFAFSAGVYFTRHEPDPLRLVFDQRRPTLLLTFLAGVGSVVGLYLENEYILSACLLVAFVVITPLPLFDFSPFAATTDDEFKTLLKDAEGLRYFETYLVNELSFENLFFFIEASGFKESKEAETQEEKDELVQIAQDIYNRYIPHNSILSINIGWRATEKITEAFENLRQGELVNRSVFDLAIKETYQLMANYSFPRFKTTLLYKMYLGIIETDPEILANLEGQAEED